MLIFENLRTGLALYSFLWWMVAAILLVATCTFINFIYNVYFHPLSGYPGPWLARASRLWYCWYCLRGDLVYKLHHSHEFYGEVIRIAPNELSYTNPDAWNDIYGHRAGKAELAKDPIFYSSVSSGAGSILNADRARHGYLRKQASHGFSERALKSQEHVIQKYADQFIHRLQECARKEEDSTVDIVSWFNFFTFDVMGDLVFGQSFDCLVNWGYHPWVQLIFDSVKAASFVRCSKYWPALAPLARLLIPTDMKRRRADQRQMAKEKATFRRELKDNRHDLISGYLKAGSEVTPLEYQSTVETFIIAGSETTATLMSGVTYHLLKDPQRLEKLKREIRTTYACAEEIDIGSVNNLPYLLACLNEALRIYPPVADTFPRNTGPQAEVICGREVPPNTVLGVNQWSTYHSTRNFTRPDDFVPERWIKGEKGFEADRKEALQAFHVGPRSCLGRNLAYFEMRLLMARLFWHFDLELDPRSIQWHDQKVYLLWEKPAMYVKLLPRN